MLLVEDDEFKQYEQQWQLEKAIQETKVQLAKARLRPQVVVQAQPTPVLIQDDRLRKAQEALVDAQKRLLEEQKQFANLKSLSEKERIELEEKKRLIQRTVNEKEQALKQVQDAYANAQQYQQKLQAAQIDLNIKQQELFRAQNEVAQLKLELTKKGGYTLADIEAQTKPFQDKATQLAAQLADNMKFIAALNEKYKKELGEKDAALIQKDAELAARLKRLEQADADIAAAKMIIAEKNAALNNVIADLKEAEEQSAEVIASQLTYIDGLKKEQKELEQDLEAQVNYQQELLNIGQAQEAEINQLKQGLGKLVESEAGLKVELQGMKDERARLELQIQNKIALEKHILLLQKQIADKEREHVRELQQEQARYDERKAEMQGEIAQLRSELSQAADLEKQAQDDLVLADKKIEQLEKQVDDMSQAGLVDKTAIDSLRREIQDLNIEKIAKNEEIQKVQFEKQDLEERIRQDNLKIAALTEQSKQQQKMYADLMVQLNRELVENQQLKTQLEDVAAKLQQAEQLQQNLERRNNALEEKLEMQDAEIESLQAQIEELVDQKEKALAQAAQAEALVVQNKVVIEELQKQIAIERDQKEEMQAAFNAEMDKAAGEIAKVRSEAKKEIQKAIRERDEQAVNYGELHDKYIALVPLSNLKQCMIDAKNQLNAAIDGIQDPEIFNKLNDALQPMNKCLGVPHIRHKK